MKRTVTGTATTMVLVALCGLAGLAPPRTARADEQTETSRRGAGKMSEERERRLMGTIGAIDKEAREVTINGEGGESERFTVPSSFKGFDKLKVGDKVNVRYMESVALSLGKPGEKAGVQTRSGSTQLPGEGRNGSTVHQVEATAEIVSVDPRKHEVTFKGPEGNTRTITVDDPQLREKLGTLKPGDTIRLTYTEAIAGSITPATKK
jgi:hypothetical protein